MEVNRCFRCMEEHTGAGACPHCGFELKKHTPEIYQLPPGTVLSGKYLLGVVLGEGGFGISYVGWDLNLDQKVAIKEYYPRDFVTRQAAYSPTITVLTGNHTEYYGKGKEQFVKEAKRLAKFDRMPGIVYVKDFFEENGTAYMVMEFAEGKTLKQIIQENGTRLPVERVLEMMAPVMQSLSEIHKQGMIHRDISPDNMVVDHKGNIKLLDFGAARDYLSEKERSLSVILKPGYTPEEQYRSRGSQGPWTDVYALCATIYYAVTGIVPLESLDRMNEDILKRPSELGVILPPEWENAIMKGMAVYQQNRFQSMEELLAAFGKETTVRGKALDRIPVPVNGAEQVQTGNPVRKKKNVPLMAGAGIAVVAVIAMLIFFFSGKSIDYEYQIQGDEVTIEAYTGNASTVEIPSEIEGKQVTKIDGAFQTKTSIESVAVPESVKEIGTNAFQGCSGLTLVSLSDGLVSIGEQAFSGCKNLTEVKFPDSVKEIGKAAFENCKKLQQVALPDGATAIKASAFKGCQEIGKITMTAEQAALVAEDAFEDSVVLELTDYQYETDRKGITIQKYKGFSENVDIPSELFGKTVIRIGESAFQENENLKEVLIPEGITLIGKSAFQNCTALGSVKLSNSVTKIGENAFQNCTKLGSIKLPDSVTSLGKSAFSNCSAMKSVTISKHIRKIEANTFYNCKNLTSIAVPAGVKKIGEKAFYNCTRISKAYIPADCKIFGAFDGRGNITFVATKQVGGVQIRVTPKKLSRDDFAKSSGSLKFDFLKDAAHDDGCFNGVYEDEEEDNSDTFWTNRGITTGDHNKQDVIWKYGKTTCQKMDIKKDNLVYTYVDAGDTSSKFYKALTSCTYYMDYSMNIRNDQYTLRFYLDKEYCVKEIEYIKNYARFREWNWG